MDDLEIFLSTSYTPIDMEEMIAKTWRDLLLVALELKEKKVVEESVRYLVEMKRVDVGEYVRVEGGGELLALVSGEEERGGGSTRFRKDGTRKLTRRTSHVMFPFG